jgi:hypothetical protein
VLARLGVRGTEEGAKALPEGSRAAFDSRWDECDDDDDLVEERDRVRGGKVRGIREGGMLRRDRA